MTCGSGSGMEQLSPPSPSLLPQAAAAAEEGSADSAALQWALTLTSRIPFDEDGKMTSIGSIFHHQGGCKPCRFHHHPGKPEGCQYGVGCLFCHFHHERRRRRVANGRTPPSGCVSPQTGHSAVAMAAAMMGSVANGTVGGHENHRHNFNDSSSWPHHPAYPQQMQAPPPPPTIAPSYVIPGKHLAAHQRPPPPMDPTPPLPPPPPSTSPASSSSSAQPMAPRKLTFSASSPALSQLPLSAATPPMHSHARFPVGSVPPLHIPPPPSAKPPPSPPVGPSATTAAAHYVPSPPHPLSHLRNDSSPVQSDGAAAVTFSHHNTHGKVPLYGPHLGGSCSVSGSFGNGFYTPPARFVTPSPFLSGGRMVNPLDCQRGLVRPPPPTASTTSNNLASAGASDRSPDSFATGPFKMWQSRVPGGGHGEQAEHLHHSVAAQPPRYGEQSVPSKLKCNLSQLALNKSENDTFAPTVTVSPAMASARAESLDGRLTTSQLPLDGMFKTLSVASKTCLTVGSSSLSDGNTGSTPSTCSPSGDSVNDDVSSPGLDMPPMCLPPLSTAIADAVLKSSTNDAELLTELLSRLLSPTAPDSVLHQLCESAAVGTVANGWDAKTSPLSTNPRWNTLPVLSAPQPDLHHNPLSGAELGTVGGPRSTRRRLSNVSVASPSSQLADPWDDTTQPSLLASSSESYELNDLAETTHL